MTDPDSPDHPARLWLLFDGSPGSQVALSEALAFANSKGFELRALYVEDQALVNCSGLPLSREIGAVSGRARSSDPSSYVHAQAVRLQRAQACLDHLMGGSARSIPLESHRGLPIPILKRLISGKDWVVAGRGGFASSHSGRLGSLTRCLIDDLHSPLLLASWSGSSKPGPWALVLDPATPVDKTLVAARALIDRTGIELIVVADPEIERPDPISVDSDQPSMPWVRMRIAGPLALHKLISDHGVGGFMAPASSAVVKNGLPAGWLLDVDRPLIIMRP